MEKNFLSSILAHIHINKIKESMSTNPQYQILFRNQRYSDGKQQKQLKKLNVRE